MSLPVPVQDWETLQQNVQEHLAANGAQIVMSSRNKDQGKQAYMELSSRAASRVAWIPTDLSFMCSVRELATTIIDKYERVDLLFNCAGVQHMKRTLTAEGLEAMFATNYLSCFLLTNLLYKKLLAGSPAKVVTVSGSGHKRKLSEGTNQAVIDFTDLQGEKHFSFAKASKQAVLAKIIFTYELARRWQNLGIEVCTVCPGLTKTNLVSHLPWYVRTFMAFRYALSGAQSPVEGACHLIKLAGMPGVNGKYYEGSKNGMQEAKSSDDSYNIEIAAALWKVSEELVGQSFNY